MVSASEREESTLKAFSKTYDLSDLFLEKPRPIFSVVAFLALGLLCYMDEYRSFMNSIFQNRSIMLATLATIFGALMGFIITAQSIFMSHWHSENLRYIREHKLSNNLISVFPDAIRDCAAATVVSVVSLLWNSNDNLCHGLTLLSLLLAVLASFSVARCFSTFKKTIELLANKN